MLFEFFNDTAMTVSLFCPRTGITISIPAITLQTLFCQVVESPGNDIGSKRPRRKLQTQFLTAVFASGQTGQSLGNGLPDRIGILVQNPPSSAAGVADAWSA
jgi:hypothetical protein